MQWWYTYDQVLLGMQISYIGNKKFLNLGKANAGARVWDAVKVEG